MTAQGICPACEEPGPIAAPCAREACARRGRHCVPVAYAPGPGETFDGYIGQKWGDYLITRKLGAGGVGAVYLALQCPLLMECALKLFPEASPASSLAGRFEAEASALARLRHPNIVRLLQFGHHGDRPFLVMEYVPGGRTLLDLMRAGLDRQAAVDILRQTAQGLEAAHLTEIVHRDIKPANIMIQALPGQPHYVRLVDFGLAKFADTGTSTQVLAGTPTYMAPEQLTKRNIGPWSDWYALGAIAFELLTGRRPFPAGGVNQLVVHKSNPAYDPITQVADLGLPPALIAFLRRALAYDPRERPAGAGAFMAELEAALLGFDGRAPVVGALGLGTDGPTATSAEMRGETHSERLDPPRARRPWLIPAAAVATGLVIGAVVLMLQPDERASGAAEAPVIEPPGIEASTIEPAPAPAAPLVAEPAEDETPVIDTPIEAAADAGVPDAAPPDAAPVPTPPPIERPRATPPVTAAPSRPPRPVGGSKRDAGDEPKRKVDEKKKKAPSFKVDLPPPPGLTPQ